MSAASDEAGASGQLDRPIAPNDLSCLVSIAEATWRLLKLSKRLAEKLDLQEAGRSASQIRFLERRIEEDLARAGLRLVNLEGVAFDPGMAVSALNAADFDTSAQLYVEQMIEPIVMGPEGLVKRGTVMLGKATE